MSMSLRTIPYVRMYRSLSEQQLSKCTVFNFIIRRYIVYILTDSYVPGPFKCNLRPNILHQDDDKLEAIIEPDQIPNACAGRSV
jgi:hypothetical protein